MLRIMIGSEKTGILHIHKGIVRANKREVNDYISMVNSSSFREGWCKSVQDGHAYWRRPALVEARKVAVVESLFATDGCAGRPNAVRDGGSMFFHF